MAGREIRESVTVAGRAERARLAGAFVGGVLGPGHPGWDDAALLVSELSGNGVRHSRSIYPGSSAQRTASRCRGRASSSDSRPRARGSACLRGIAVAVMGSWLLRPTASSLSGLICAGS